MFGISSGSRIVLGVVSGLATALSSILSVTSAEASASASAVCQPSPRSTPRYSASGPRLFEPFLSPVLGSTIVGPSGLSGVQRGKVSSASALESITPPGLYEMPRSFVTLSKTSRSNGVY